MSGFQESVKRPRQPILVMLPQLLSRSASARSRSQLRQHLRACLEHLAGTAAGKEAMSRVRPVMIAGRMPRQWWGALTWRPFVLINPVIANDTEGMTNALAHEYGHCLFQTSLGSRIVDSLEQERSAEHVKARTWVERHGTDRPDYYQNAGWVLDEPPESAYQVIRQWTPFYARLPEQQPRWYEIRKWWPVIRFWTLGK